MSGPTKNKFERCVYNFLKISIKLKLHLRKYLGMVAPSINLLNEDMAI